MTSNPLVVDPNSLSDIARAIEVLKPLVAEFGQRNVEQTLIYIQKACTPKGLQVRIQATPEMVRAILEAVHRRMGVNEVRVSL